MQNVNSLLKRASASLKLAIADSEEILQANDKTWKATNDYRLAFYRNEISKAKNVLNDITEYLADDRD